MKTPGSIKLFSRQPILTQYLLFATILCFNCLPAMAKDSIPQYILDDAPSSLTTIINSSNPDDLSQKSRRSTL